MALITCPECGKAVSDEVKVCIQCGYPIQKWLREQKKNQGKKIVSNQNKDEEGSLENVNIKSKEETISFSGDEDNERNEKTQNDSSSSNNKKSHSKLLIGVVSGIVVLIIFGILISKHIICLNHEFLPATCIEAETCKYCGKTKGESLGHDWKEATCTEPKTCSVCKETEGEPLGHNWKEATCTEPKTCSVCKQKSGTSLGHKEGSWETVSEAKLSKSGKKQKKCLRCNKVTDTENEYKTPLYEYGSYNFGAEEFVTYLNGLLKSGSKLDWTQVQEIEDDKSKVYAVPFCKNDSFTGATVGLIVNDSENVQSFLVMGQEAAVVEAVAIIIAQTTDNSIDENDVMWKFVTMTKEFECGSTYFLFGKEDKNYMIGIKGL